MGLFANFSDYHFVTILIFIFTCGIQNSERVHNWFHQLFGQTVHLVVLQVQLLERVQILKSQRWQHFDAEIATQRQLNKSSAQIHTETQI